MGRQARRAPTDAAGEKTAGTERTRDEPTEKRLNLCTLLSNMKPCWDKADDLVAQLKTCGQLGTTYSDGLREELDRLNVTVDEQALSAAAFSCSGICTIKRHDPKLSWSEACAAAATAMKCEPSACAP